MTDIIEEFEKKRGNLRQQIEAKYAESKIAPMSSVARIALELAELRAQDKLLASQIEITQYIMVDRRKTEARTRPKNNNPERDEDRS